MTRRPWILRLLAALAVASAALVAFAPAASAHAELESTNPADGSVVPKAPKQVTLTYGEGVSVNLGSVRVFDHSGKRVDQGDSRNGAKSSEVVVGLKPNLPHGTYLVAWRVVSADTHPVHGGFTFSIVTKGALDKGVDQSLLGGSGDEAWQVVAAVLRIVGYGGLLLAVGGAVFLVGIDEEAGPLRSKLIRVGGIVGVVAGVLDIPVQAVLATGLGLSSATDTEVLKQVLGDGVAVSLLVAAAGAFALAWATRSERKPDKRLAWAGVLAIAISFAVAGHPRTTEPTWLAMLSDAVHATAGGIWFGGLVLLVITLRGNRTDDDPVGAANALGRFSAAATWALAAVSVFGLILAYLEVKALSALTSTTYGKVLLVKVAVVAGVALLGAYNRFRLVPVVEDAEAEQATKAPAWSKLRTIIRVEAAGLAAVVVLTGVLVNIVPARTAAGIGQVVSVTAPLGSDRSVNMVVDPAQQGTNVLHLYVLDKLGRPVDDVQTMSVELTLPSKNIGPLDHDLFKAGPGHFQINGLQFPLTGTWQVVAVARIDKFTEDRATMSVPIR